MHGKRKSKEAVRFTDFFDGILGIKVEPWDPGPLQYPREGEKETKTALKTCHRAAGLIHTQVSPVPRLCALRSESE